jgi:microcystin-dependent protein
MSQPYVGEIRMFAGNFAPAGWLFCDGSLLPIAEFETLFFLIGTTYGGDGQSTFALPDLRGRVPVHQGTGFFLGQSGGSEQVTLSNQQMPSHSHPLIAASSNGTASAGPGGMIASSSSPMYFGSDVAFVDMANPAIGPAGASQPHENRAPYLAVNFIISMFGIFPSQS